MFKRIVILAVCAFVLTVANDASADLVGHWRFDEGSGTIASDVSGNGNDGTLMGDPQWITGVIGGALEFDGDGDYVDCGNDAIFDITEEITLAIWVNANDMLNGEHNCWLGKGDNTYAIKHQSGNYLEFFIYDGDWHSTNYTTDLDSLIGEWHHMAGTFDGSELKFYLDGEEAANLVYSGTIGTAAHPVTIGENSQATGRYFDGMLDDPRIYNEALSPDDIESIMLGGAYPYALSPNPADGAMHPDTWVTLSWRAGDFAVTHDIYLGDNDDDVNDGTGDTYRGNQGATYYVAGFPGFAYPEGLIPGTTYYWRIDEVNEADPNSPWKGPVWSFSIPPKKAYAPNPADGADSVPLDAQLSWTAGLGTRLHTVYFGEDFDTVADATVGVPAGTTTYNPGPLEPAKIYYWRVDEFDGLATYQGDIWSFTTPGTVANPQPAYNAEDVGINTTLSWTPADSAVSHQLYFGTDEASVRNADTSSPEYKGSKALGDERFDPGLLDADTTYYWRVDEIDTQSNTMKGPLWIFTTGHFLLVDDFESYTDDDTAGEAIWQTWIDGFGISDNGAQVGYLLPPYAEQTIVHSGSQSMPLLYDNNAGVTNSEGSTTLALRDWTLAGVETLSLWFQGSSDNANEPLYVAISNTAGTPITVVHDDVNATQNDSWTEWIISLQTFSDQGIDLTNVDKIAIGLGSKSGVTTTGGSGTIYIDDIRIYLPAP